jgi:hypothetical protein
MTLPNSEPRGGEPVLQREARKALSGRVPVILSIVLALLSGMLVGYSVRALSVEERAEWGSRGIRCPRSYWRLELIDPSPGAGHARLHYLHGDERGLDAVPADDKDTPAGSAAAPAPAAY